MTETKEKDSLNTDDNYVAGKTISGEIIYGSKIIGQFGEEMLKRYNKKIM